MFFTKVQKKSSKREETMKIRNSMYSDEEIVQTISTPIGQAEIPEIFSTSKYTSLLELTREYQRQINFMIRSCKCSSSGDFKFVVQLLDEKLSKIMGEEKEGDSFLPPPTKKTPETQPQRVDQTSKASMTEGKPERVDQTETPNVSTEQETFPEKTEKSDDELFSRSQSILNRRPSTKNKKSDPFIVSIAAGMNFYLLSETGNVWVGGNNYHGELHIGPKSPYHGKVCPDIVKVDTSVFREKIVKIYCSETHAFFVTKSNKIWAAGWNSYGMCGVGYLRNGSNDQSRGGDSVVSPVQLNLFSKHEIVQISASSTHSLFLDSSGEAYSCGRNENGELGLGTVTPRQGNTSTGIPKPTNVEFFSKRLCQKVIYVCAGKYNSFFVTSLGEVFACGVHTMLLAVTDNLIRPKLHGSPARMASFNIPMKITGLKGIIQVQTGRDRTFFLASDGRVLASPRQSSGKRYSDVSSQFFGGTKIVKISSQISNSQSTLFLDEHGDVWTMGFNRFGALGIGKKGDSHASHDKPIKLSGRKYVDIAGGVYRSVFLDKNGVAYITGNAGVKIYENCVVPTAISVRMDE